MKKEIKISDAEWKVMEVVWKEPGILIGELRKALEDSGWSYSTIKTMALRLIKKGALRVEDSPKGKRYYSAAAEGEVRASETKSFLERVYDGSLKRMVSNLVQESSLSENDVEELMKIVDKIDD